MHCHTRAHVYTHTIFLYSIATLTVLRISNKGLSSGVHYNVRGRQKELRSSVLTEKAVVALAKERQSNDGCSALIKLISDLREKGNQARKRGSKARSGANSRNQSAKLASLSSSSSSSVSKAVQKKARQSAVAKTSKIATTFVSTKVKDSTKQSKLPDIHLKFGRGLENAANTFLTQRITKRLKPKIKRRNSALPAPDCQGGVSKLPVLREDSKTSTASDEKHVHSSSKINNNSRGRCSSAYTLETKKCDWSPIPAFLTQWELAQGTMSRENPAAYLERRWYTTK